ncbi:MAG: response regulator transcription factor [Ectothiorhodospiraceae bacterium]|nr:response regulator transcription factor [Ectothiorhodospiraceae bacterium]
MRVLVIEDEATLRQELHTHLAAAGYNVDLAADGEEGLYLGREYPVDVAVVDLGLPRLDGLEVIRRWRGAGRAFPVLVLTARGRWQDKVEGLEAGGDDYLVKPFHVEELLARLRALVRRSAGWGGGQMICGPVVLDPREQRVSRDGAAVDLTSYEYRVLHYLMLHAGEVVSKTELTEHVYAEDADRDSNVLEVLIGRVRRKLDPERTLDPIETLRGRGYRFRLARAGS